MTDPRLRSKALAKLRSGDVSIYDARDAISWVGRMQPQIVHATVRSGLPGATAPYAVDYDVTRGWSCTCRLGHRREACGHVLAVKLVTGWA